jgi:hypothetical protein
VAAAAELLRLQLVAAAEVAEQVLVAELVASLVHLLPRRPTAPAAVSAWAALVV